MSRGRSRFKLQKSGEFVCGPIAVHNAKVWQTGSAPNWQTILDACRATDIDGTPQYRILLGEFALRTSKVLRIQRWLNDGHGCILLYATQVSRTKFEAHYVFVHPHTAHSNISPNIMVRNAVCYQKNQPDYAHIILKSWHQFQHLFMTQLDVVLSTGFHEHFPVAWRVIRKS